MTRPHNAQYHCSNCKTWQTQETLFGRWIRQNKEIESVQGYCVTDQDYWIHKFKTHGNREFQLLMLVEIKTMGASLTDAQRDLLLIIDQFLRNRRDTPTKDARWCAGNYLTVWSAMNGRRIKVRAFGMHLLTFSGLGPDDSEKILWDKTEINVDTLTSILRFDLDPDTLKALDLRNHHRTHLTQVLPLPLLEDTEAV